MTDLERLKVIRDAFLEGNDVDAVRILRELDPSPLAQEMERRTAAFAALLTLVMERQLIDLSSEAIEIVKINTDGTVDVRHQIGHGTAWQVRTIEASELLRLHQEERASLETDVVSAIGSRDLTEQEVAAIVNRMQAAALL